MASSESVMPIYEYSCGTCVHEFEAIRGVKAENPPCPKCGARTEKKISLSAFHLKGGGWYSDAYAGSDNKSPAASSSAGESESGGSGSASSSDGGSASVGDAD